MAEGFPYFALNDDTSTTSYPTNAIVDSMDVVYETQSDPNAPEVVQYRRRTNAIIHLDVATASLNDLNESWAVFIKQKLMDGPIVGLAYEDGSLFSTSLEPPDSAQWQIERISVQHNHDATSVVTVALVSREATFSQ